MLALASCVQLDIFRRLLGVDLLLSWCAIMVAAVLN
jgi:hypothetical protein